VATQSGQPAAQSVVITNQQAVPPPEQKQG
jgi:hypothetical protein